MDPDSTSELLLLIFLIALNAFFAASEIAIISVKKLRLRELVEQGNPAAKRVIRLSEESTRLLATVQIGITLAGFFSATTAAVNLGGPLSRLLSQIPVPFITHNSLSLAQGTITALLSLVMLVLGELVPKAVALEHAENIALRVAVPIDLLSTLMRPLVLLLVFCTNRITGLLGVKQQTRMPFVTPEEIMTLVDAGEETGTIEGEEKEMIYSIFELRDTYVREVMVPRTDMLALDVETSPDEAVNVILSAGHSRIPVYEHSIDNIVGLLYAKDLLHLLRDRRELSDLRALLRKSFFVPETKNVADLFQEMQQQKIHMAIVVDEYGGTSGLATIEDLLEEIVGEIQDEYDTEEEPMQIISPTETLFDARVSVDDVNHFLGLSLRNEESDTIGGLIFNLMAKVPEEDDQVQVDGVILQVAKVEEQRIKKVRLIRLTADLKDARDEEETDTHAHEYGK
ncbi:MAG: HlyC/CorC family transporter [Chloroflexi bacterium]|nr:HlyC/CorC family transporter [Chloroflexota bacterium]